MNCIELFAGAGGMALGLKAAGLDCRLAVETDPHACATLRRNFPDLPILERRLEVSDGDGPPPEGVLDLLAGGPPCQDFSQAGRGEGARGSRNGFPAFLALTKRLRPRAVIVENVPGLVQKQHRAYLDLVLDGFTSLDLRMQHRVLDASDFGVPQTRRRVFLVGFRDAAAAARFGWPAPTHGSCDGLPAKTTAGEALRDLSPDHDPKPLSARAAAYLQRHEEQLYAAKHPPVRADRPAPTVVANIHRGVPYGLITTFSGEGTPPVGTLRLLTVREEARLQGFPDVHVFEGGRTAQLTQVGNACPPKLAEVVARAVRSALEG